TDRREPIAESCFPLNNDSLDPAESAALSAVQRRVAIDGRYAHMRTVRPRRPGAGGGAAICFRPPRRHCGALWIHVGLAGTDRAADRNTCRLSPARDARVARGALARGTD